MNLAELITRWPRRRQHYAQLHEQAKRWYVERYEQGRRDMFNELLVWARDRDVRWRYLAENLEREFEWRDDG